jgi:hypothetical protein
MENLADTDSWNRIFNAGAEHLQCTSYARVEPSPPKQLPKNSMFLAGSPSPPPPPPPPLSSGTDSVCGRERDRDMAWNRDTDEEVSV